MRVARRWNQTGQKHAGEPDIARSIFPKHISLLWILVYVTYLYIAWRLSRCTLPLLPGTISSAIFLTLCFAALRFKIAFVKADAPELLTGLPRLFIDSAEIVSLVLHCKAIFLGIGTLMSVAVSSKAFHRRSQKTDDISKTKLLKWYMSSDKFSRR